MTEHAITGTTQLVGLIGWPVSHSRSPRMHNAAFAALGLDWAYVPLPAPPDRVPQAVRGLVALGFRGANVTVPHKQTVMAQLDVLTPAARAAGAVNTITVRADGTLCGDTTDGRGFLADLREQCVTPRRALLLGSGGAARSVAYALAETGVDVLVAARSVAKATDLCEALADQLPPRAGRITAHGLPRNLRACSTDADLVVNATSLGLHADDPLPWDPNVPIRPNQVVYDLVYTHTTPLMSLAARQGARAIGGLGMLVHQGALALTQWTGLEAPIGVMRAAIED